MCYDRISQPEETDIITRSMITKTTPEHVRTGDYLYSDNHHYPLCIVSKRELPTDAGPRIFELGLSAQVGIELVKRVFDAKIEVLSPRYVPLDHLSRTRAFA